MLAVNESFHRRVQPVITVVLSLRAAVISPLLAAALIPTLLPLSQQVSCDTVGEPGAGYIVCSLWVQLSFRVYRSIIVTFCSIDGKTAVCNYFFKYPEQMGGETSCVQGGKEVLSC